MVETVKRERTRFLESCDQRLRKTQPDAVTLSNPRLPMARAVIAAWALQKQYRAPELVAEPIA
jgi:hypothetical protein